GQAEVRAQQATREHRDDRARRPRQDDPDRGDQQDAGAGRRRGGARLQQHRQRPRGAGPRHHHRAGPRRVRDPDAPLRPHRRPRPRRLHQEHDHRRRPDGRGDPGGQRPRRPDATDPGAHPPGAAGRRPQHGRLPEQGRHDGRRGAAGAGRARDPGAALAVRLPRRRDPDRARVGAGGAVEHQHRRDGAGVRADPGADADGRRLRADAGAGGGAAVPDADRGRVRDQGPRHGGDRPGRARDRADRGRDRDRRDGHAAQGDRDRRGDVPEDAGRGPGRRQRRGALAGRGADRCGAGAGAEQARHDQPAHEVPGRGVRADQGGGGAAHAVLPGVPAAVLHPDDRRDGGDHPERRGGDGDAGGQRADGGGADHARGGGRGAAVRDPGGRPDGRCRGRHQDRGV
ncbi:MAG: Translation elongation factor Tu, partial [uncultured Thermomicrobiales bacterium]